MSRAGTAYSRTGFALPLSLIALLVIGAMVTGLAHATIAEAARARDEAARVRADAAADYANHAVMRDWIPGAADSLATGDTLPAWSGSFAGTLLVSRTTRLSPSLWWTTASATDGFPRPARRGVNTIWRTTRPEPDLRAALTVADSVELADSALVTGSDSAAASFPWCPAATSVAAVRMPDSLRLCDGPCGAGAGARLAGTPDVLQDTMAAVPALHDTFGSESRASLAAMADITLPPGAVVTPAPRQAGGTCDRAAADNWGDPLSASPCASYSPIVHALGDVEVRGGVGQGILIVDGDLVLSQGARLDGLVLVADDILTGPGAGELWGAAFAADSRRGPSDHTRLAGSARVRYSSCALESVFRKSGRLVPLSRRAWAVVR